MCSSPMTACLASGQTYPTLLDSLSENRVGVAANCVGMARAALEAAQSYAAEREVAGKVVATIRRSCTGSPIWRRKLKRRAGWSITEPGASIRVRSMRRLPPRSSSSPVKRHCRSVRQRSDSRGRGHHARLPVGRIHRDALVYVIPGEGHLRYPAQYRCTHSMGVQAMSQSIRVERSDMTMLIRLNKPERRNAFDLNARRTCRSDLRRSGRSRCPLLCWPVRRVPSRAAICGHFPDNAAWWPKIAIASVACIPGFVNWSIWKSP